MFEEIKKIIDHGEYEYYGIRVLPDQDMIVSIGDQLPDSYIWEDGENTGESIDGVCAVQIRDGNIEKTMKYANIYFGKKCVLIGGDFVGYGEDDEEIIFRDIGHGHRVLHTFNK